MAAPAAAPIAALPAAGAASGAAAASGQAPAPTVSSAPVVAVPATAASAPPPAAEAAPVLPPVTPVNNGASLQAVQMAHRAPLWKPAPGIRWQWQESGDLDVQIAAELFIVNLQQTPASTIEALHAAQRKVICSFHAGIVDPTVAEAGSLSLAVAGSKVDEKQELRWLDIRNPAVQGWVEKQLEQARDKRCDGVLPNGLDGYTVNSGYPLSAQEQLTFNRWLADAAHARQLSVGLRNDSEQARSLQAKFDWALNEQCFEYGECNAYQPFIAAGKAVLGVEYQGESSDFCPKANALKYDWLKKNTGLDAFRVACRP